ncbi:MAG: MFS transporter, partial [Bryobacteraceae bacterium]
MTLTGIAIVGTVTSFGIPRVAAKGHVHRFEWNPWAEILKGMRHLRANRVLWLTVIAISYFWFLGALMQMDVIVLGKEVLHASELRTGMLSMFIALGIGAGSIAAGRLSGDKVELGLVPLGSIGMGVSLLVLSALGARYAETAMVMAALGLSAGLFAVPLNALLQQKSERRETGRILATNNFLNTAGVLLASGAFYLLHDAMRMSPSGVILVLGLFTLAGTVFALKILPDFLIRFSLWLLTHTVYKIRIEGQEHVPFRGPALLVVNHVSFVDGFLVGACIQRFVRFMVYKPYYEMKGVNWLFRLMKAIPVAGGNRREIIESLDRARAELEGGHVVCIFAEGAISRTGNLLPFKRGFERIVDGLDVPVIPVHLDRLWGSVFSFAEGKFLWKRPRKFPYPVTVTFGWPLSSKAKAHEVRQAMLELGARATEQRRDPRDVLERRFVETARANWSEFCMADSMGQELTFGRALAGSLILARKFRKYCGAEPMVGLLIPASAGGALANIAARLAGKVPVNLNFTVGRESMNSAIEQCGIKTIITSKVFLAKAKIEAREGMVFLEDLLKGASGLEKAVALVKARVAPLRSKAKAHDLATVIFSSGSTGTPKGVMLSHHNILSNAESIAQVFWVTERDRMMGVLPFFHSFGFTVGLWFPLVAGFGVVYHANPVDASRIGELVEQYGATLLVSTPTFYSTYTRKCHATQFHSLRWCLVGAEKLRDSVAGPFREKFNLDLLEGYGATEMSPVIAVNTPNVEEGREKQTGTKPGTVGHPLPGVAAKVVDPDSFESLPAGKEGLLLVRGPNRMMGYLNQPQKTAEVLRDGWYVTGDIAAIDDDGFIRITDRLARFSKIGGEMVPHIKIELALQEVVGTEAECVVTAVPDEQKGERLVVFHTAAGKKAADLWEALNAGDLPKIWIPKRESIVYVESIPKLGTGKIDLGQVKKMALG